MNRNQAVELVLGLAVGGTLGVFAGLMLAPASGNETRRRLREIAEKTRARSQSTLESGLKIAGDQASRLGRAFEEGRRAFDRETASARITSALKEGIEGEPEAS